MISVPIATNDIAFRNQLSIFWDNHKLIYGDNAYKKAHAIIVSQNYPEQEKIGHDEWSLDIPSTVVEPYWSYLKRENSNLLLPINIQVGLSQIIDKFEDDEILELIDCDMFHLREYKEQEVNENEFLVCEIYENWHLKSNSDSYGVIENFLDKDQSGYNGGFVPIIGYVKTFKKILKYWTNMHLQVFDSTDERLTKWWSGMYSFQVACANHGIKMKAIDNCYVPGVNELKENHHIAHYCCDTVFDKKKELRKPDKFDYSGFPNNYFYDRVKDWMKKMNTIKGKIIYELPEPLIKKPFYIESFFTPEMFERVKENVKEIGFGSSKGGEFHTMLARWESPIKFDEDIENYCVEKAKHIFRDNTLLKAYFFVVQYQYKDNCIPHLWEHTDQNGTQTTIDVTVENTAEWDIVVEEERFKQEPNNAIIFCGQQHIHSRPPYPTTDPNKYVTVLFLHFTKPDHWIQNNKLGIYEYGKDGDVRFFNRNRYLAMPDGPINQPVCACHDYSGVLNLYDEIVGHAFDIPPEIVDMGILDKTELAPGIIKYKIARESARVLKGLIQNAVFKQWEPAAVLTKNNEPGINYDARNCFNYFIDDKQLHCHPQDPIRRVAESFKIGLDVIVEDFRSRYSIVPLISHHTVLLRYEAGHKFHDHIDDHPKFPRVVSISVFLNDDYDGGELEFKEFNLKIKPVAGEIVVFSSGFPYIHQVHPVTMGIRYAVVKWYQYK